MSARAVVIAEGVKTALEAAGLTGSPSVERTYRPREAAAKLAGPSVLVTWTEWEPGDRISRSMREAQYRISVGLVVPIGTSSELDETDAATDLMDEIAAALDTDIEGASFAGVSVPVPWDADSLSDADTFKGVLVATYTEGRP